MFSRHCLLTLSGTTTRLVREHETRGTGQHFLAFALAALIAPLLLGVLFAGGSHTFAVFAQTLAVTIVIVLEEKEFWVSIWKPTFRQLLSKLYLILVTILRIQFAFAGTLLVTVYLKHLDKIENAVC